MEETVSLRVEVLGRDHTGRSQASDPGYVGWKRAFLQPWVTPAGILGLGARVAPAGGVSGGLAGHPAAARQECIQQQQFEEQQAQCPQPQGLLSRP